MNEKDLVLKVQYVKITVNIAINMIAYFLDITILHVPNLKFKTCFQCYYYYFITFLKDEIN